MTITAAENLTEELPANRLAEPKPAFHAMALYAWIVVSLTILVGAAILGHVEDEQGVRADDTREQSTVVAD